MEHSDFGAYRDAVVAEELTVAGREDGAAAFKPERVAWV
jgi:hypothetical protein